MPGVGVEKHHVGVEKERVVFVGDMEKVAHDDDLPAAVLDDESQGAGSLGAMVHGEGRDGKVSQRYGHARLQRAEVAPLGQVAMDAVGAVFPALLAGIDRQRPGLVRPAVAQQAHRKPVELGEMVEVGMGEQDLVDDMDAVAVLELQQRRHTPMPQSISVCRTTWPSCRWTSEYETLACR